MRERDEEIPMEKRTARLTMLIDPQEEENLRGNLCRHDLTPSQVVRKLVRQYIIDNAGGRELPAWLKPQARSLSKLSRDHPLALRWQSCPGGERQYRIVFGLHFRGLLGNFAQDACDGPDHDDDPAGRAGNRFCGRRRKVGQNRPFASGKPTGTYADTGKSDYINHRV
jgi:hypothetical protein